jgi:hypothetical protein
MAHDTGAPRPNRPNRPNRPKISSFIFQQHYPGG